MEIASHINRVVFRGAPFVSAIRVKLAQSPSQCASFPTNPEIEV